MRRPVLFLIVFLSFLFILLPVSLFVQASSDKMILPDPASVGDGMDAILVIDVSGSMKQSDPDLLCKKAALDYIEELSLTPRSRAGLVTFSDTIQKVIPLTMLDPDMGENDLIHELNSLSYTSGDTDIGTAMEKAASLLEDDDAGGRLKSIILLTDGEIDLPAASNEEEAEKESLTHALMAVEQAKSEGIVIHTIALDLSGHIDENLMNYMADSTGGTSSLAGSAASLDDVFRTLSDFALRQAQEAAETEEDYSFTETEAETEEETEIETETETETEQVLLFIQTIGSVDGPVHLKGLLPNLCSARLNLASLFRLDGVSSGSTSLIRYTAYTDDNSLLTCSVEGDELLLSGLKNGSTQVQIIAEPDFYTEIGGNSAQELNQAGLSFLVEVDAVIPSPWYLVLIPACLALGGILIWLLTRGRSGADLSGSLQWFVRGENEKIFGIPTQTMADLADYGKKVRLCDLVKDELLDDAPLDKVVISALEVGILVISRSPACQITEAGCDPVRRLEMTRSGRFKVYCDTGRGKAAVICFYTSRQEYRTEPPVEDDSEERTRLLV